MSNNKLFAFASIWLEWKNKQSNEIIYSYTIVTTEANELLSKIQNKKNECLLFLLKKNEQAWLNNYSLNNFKTNNIKLKSSKI